MQPAAPAPFAVSSPETSAPVSTPEPSLEAGSPVEATPDTVEEPVAQAQLPTAAAPVSQPNPAPVTQPEASGRKRMQPGRYYASYNKLTHAFDPTLVFYPQADRPTQVLTVDNWIDSQFQAGLLKQAN